jgi:hypothetical protein
MNPLLASPGAAQMIARQTIQDRIADAERHAQVREARAARRSERRAARQARVTGFQASYPLSRWVFKALRPAR